MAKVRLESYIVQKAKIVENVKKGTTKVRLGSYIVQKAKIRYG